MDLPLDLITFHYIYYTSQRPSLSHDVSVSIYSTP